MYGISVLEDAPVVTRKHSLLRLHRLLHSICTFVATELHKPGAYLFPVRVFLAVGWLRACGEKLLDPWWLNGTKLTAFLTYQTATGTVVFPFYQQLIDTLLLPHVVALSWIVLVGQLLVGMGMAIGLCTRGALLGGLFMNANFLLAGRPDPNAFYLIIQAMLLLEKADRVLSLDNVWAYIRKRGHLTQLKMLLARPLVGQVLSAGYTVGFAAIAVYAFVHITTFAPAASVKDPAAVLCVLAHVGMALSLITFVRRTSPALEPFEHTSRRVVAGQAYAAAGAQDFGSVISKADEAAEQAVADALQRGDSLTGQRRGQHQKIVLNPSNEKIYKFRQQQILL